MLRERSWGEINTITKDEFKNNYARNWNFGTDVAVLASAGRRVDCQCGRGPCAQHPDLAEPQNPIRNPWSWSPTATSCSPWMLDHRGIWPTRNSCSRAEDSDDWKITNCTCLHCTRRDPETGRASERVPRPGSRPPRARARRDDRPLGGQGGAVARIQAPVSLQWRFAGRGASRRPTPAWSITANSLSRKRLHKIFSELDWCVVRLVVNAVPQRERERVLNVQYLPMAIAWRRQDAGARRGSRAR